MEKEEKLIPNLEPKGWKPLEIMTKMGAPFNAQIKPKKELTQGLNLKGIMVGKERFNNYQVNWGPKC